MIVNETDVQCYHLNTRAQDSTNFVITLKCLKTFTIDSMTREKHGMYVVSGNAHGDGLALQRVNTWVGMTGVDGRESVAKSSLFQLRGWNWL